MSGMNQPFEINEEEILGLPVDELGLAEECESRRWRADLKGPKTPMHGRLRENRQECGASDVRGGVVDPEEPCSRQAKFLPI